MERDEAGMYIAVPASSDMVLLMDPSMLKVTDPVGTGELAVGAERVIVSVIGWP